MLGLMKITKQDLYRLFSEMFALQMYAVFFNLARNSAIIFCPRTEKAPTSAQYRGLVPYLWSPRYDHDVGSINSSRGLHKTAGSPQKKRHPTSRDAGEAKAVKLNEQKTSMSTKMSALLFTFAP